jgi:tRNA dimethylallyltransferase
MNTEESFSTTAKPPLALIAGPTASGKSDLAVELALALEKRGKRVVVINADASQVYGDLAVLSARPSTEDMQGIDHRLFGTWDGAVACSAADWAAAATREINAVHSEGGVPIIVGGTGLYIRTLLEGIAPIPEIDPTIRAEVRDLPLHRAYAALNREDPARAKALHPTDSTRIARALEVVRSTGRPLGDWQAEKQGAIGDTIELHPVILLPDRKWLYDRCDQRFAAMLVGGAIAEVEALMARNIAPEMPVMRAIGVRDIVAYLRGECTLEEARAGGSQATRNYIKRQQTWLRHQPPAEWPRIEAESFNVEPLFVSLLQD